MNAQIINAVEEIVATAEKFRNAYFWSSPSSASERRRYEKKYSCEEIEWEEGGHKYSAKYVVECSCRNVYAKGYYKKDGNYTTLTAIKNSLKRMKSEN